MTRIWCHICQNQGDKREFVDSSALIVHYYQDHNATFCCQYCHRQFVTEDERTNHFEKAHVSRAAFNCLICGLVAKQKKQLQQHQRETHGNLKELSCTCGFIACSMESRHTHLGYCQDNTARSKPQPSMNSERLSRESNSSRFHHNSTNDYMNRFAGSSGFLCLWCFQRYPSGAQFFDHVRTHFEREHGRTMMSCNECFTMIESMDNLGKHSHCFEREATRFQAAMTNQNKDGQMLYICRDCRFCATGSQQMNRHRGWCHNLKTCSACGKDVHGFIGIKTHPCSWPGSQKGSPYSFNFRSSAKIDSKHHAEGLDAECRQHPKIPPSNQGDCGTSRIRSVSLNEGSFQSAASSTAPIIEKSNGTDHNETSMTVELPDSPEGEHEMKVASKVVSGEETSTPIASSGQTSVQNTDQTGVVEKRESSSSSSSSSEDGDIKKEKVGTKLKTDSPAVSTKSTKPKGTDGNEVGKGKKIQSKNGSDGNDVDKGKKIQSKKEKSSSTSTSSSDEMESSNNKKKSPKVIPKQATEKRPLKNGKNSEIPGGKRFKMEKKKESSSSSSSSSSSDDDDDEPVRKRAVRPPPVPPFGRAGFPDSSDDSSSDSSSTGDGDDEKIKKSASTPTNNKKTATKLKTGTSSTVPRVRPKKNIFVAASATPNAQIPRNNADSSSRSTSTRQHHMDYEYFCTFCKRASPYRSNIQRHIELIHRIPKEQSVEFCQRRVRPQPEEMEVEEPMQNNTEQSTVVEKKNASVNANRPCLGCKQWKKKVRALEKFVTQVSSATEKMKRGLTLQRR